MIFNVHTHSIFKFSTNSSLHTCSYDTYTKMLSIIYLKFKFNSAYYMFSGNFSHGNINSQGHWHSKDLGKQMTVF